MKKIFALLIGKVVRKSARLFGGGGSTFPGKVVAKIYPNFNQEFLKGLKYGVVIISGTNGKTTTTKIVAETLENLGISVFTNPTGSNFTTGVTSSIVEQSTAGGKINKEIAVLELDEAYAAKFVESTTVTHCMILNVMRDQLDRFGEISTTANLLSKVVAATEKTVILNREDPRVRNMAENAKGKKVHFFGFDKRLSDLFPNDDELYSIPDKGSHGSGSSSGGSAGSDGSAGGSGAGSDDKRSDKKSRRDAENQKAEVVLDAVRKDGVAEIEVDGQLVEIKTKLNGIYNLFNLTGAIALIKNIVDNDISEIVKAAQDVTPAFGRGERIVLKDGSIVDLILVKNPIGFRLALKSFEEKPAETMIAINDNYADGRDVSWLWDVDFSSISSVDMVSGIRAWDMALRLTHEDVSVLEVDVEINRAIRNFLAKNEGKNKRIYATYTAMLSIRTSLSKVTTIEDVGLR
jgi:UDP-N-acetylmuramyl tripeptide synthase